MAEYCSKETVICYNVFCCIRTTDYEYTGT